MKRLRSNLLRCGALVLLTAALAPAAGAQTQPLEMKFESKGVDVLTDELKLRAKCDSACTLGLHSVGVLRYTRQGEQVGNSAEDMLKATKRLKANQWTVFRIPLSTNARSHLQSAVRNGGYALAQVAVKLNGQEGPYWQAALHARGVSVPKSFGRDDITVSLDPKLPSKPARYRISIEGVQTTNWSYNRNETNGSCTTVSNGSGKQTIRFRSNKPVVGRMSYSRKGAVLVPAQGKPPFETVMRLKAERDGVVNAGMSGDCGDVGVPSGDGGGGAPPEQCERLGEMTVWAQLSFTGRNQLNVSLDPHKSFIAPLAPEKLPSCPIESFAGSDDHLDLLDAVHKMGDPGGRDGKVIVLARRTKTDPLGGGTTKTTIRWTVTFKRVG